MKNFKFKWTTAFLVWFAAMTTVVVLNIYFAIPSDAEIKGCLITTMHEVNLCPKSGNYVTLGNISNHLKNAIIISEDGGFYNHNGFEISELKESFMTNLERGSFARGGSTITQQLARNLFLSSDKSLLRKFKEALITYKLEKVLKKNEILEKYLNVVEFGKDIYGVKEAARHYFSKSPAELNPLESAYLAFLLPSPIKYSAGFYKRALSKFTNQRLQIILYRMAAYHKISEDEYQFAKTHIQYFPWKDMDQALPAQLGPDEDVLSSDEEIPLDDLPAAVKEKNEDSLSRDSVEGDNLSDIVDDPAEDPEDL
jgi:monofunctional biosynthetic peptidoglycan transglycosylase